MANPNTLAFIHELSKDDLLELILKLGHTQLTKGVLWKNKETGHECLIDSEAFTVAVREPYRREGAVAFIRGLPLEELQQLQYQLCQVPQGRSTQFVSETKGEGYIVTRELVAEALNHPEQLGRNDILSGRRPVSIKYPIETLEDLILIPSERQYQLINERFNKREINGNQKFQEFLRLMNDDELLELMKVSADHYTRNGTFGVVFRSEGLNAEERVYREDVALIIEEVTQRFNKLKEKKS